MTKKHIYKDRVTFPQKSEIDEKKRREKKLKKEIRRSPNSTSAVFQLAQFYFDTKQNKKAYETASALLSKSDTFDTRTILLLYRLLAFSSFYINEFDETERFSRKGIELCPDGLDFYFISAINSARVKRYREAIEHCRQYLDLWENKEKNGNPHGEWDKTFNLKHQVLSAYGVALNEQQEPEKAEKVLRQAIEFNDSFDSAYINLALIMKAQGRTQEALDTVRAGLKVCPQSKQLRKMIEWSGDRATISACMIVKNEEELLPRCLQSIRDVVDEIILVDTGSTDRTLEIAEEFGCKIYHYPWKGDFSSARNESMKYATKDWIFIIDADEEFPPEEINKLRVVTNQDELKIISISVLNKNLETGQITSFLPSIRLVRRELGLQYYGIVHNRLDIPKDMQVLRADIDLYHYGYDLARDKLDKKLERSRKLLNRQLEENPDDVYANFNMAQLLRGYRDGNGPEKSNLIAEHAGRVIKNPESKTKRYFGQRLMAFHQKAIALCNLGQFDKAEECCLEALGEKEDYLDPILTLGDVYNYKSQFDKARRFYQRYLKLQAEYDAGEEIDNIILHNLEARHKAWYGLGLVAERENKPDEAIDAFRHVLKNKNPYLDTNCRLGKLYLDSGRYDEAIESFNDEIAANPDSAIAHFGIGCALAKLQRFDESIERIEKSIEMEPGFADRIYTLGKVFSLAGRDDEGMRKIIEAAQLPNGSAKIYFDAGNYLFNEGDVERAIEMYNRVLGADPDYIDAQNNLGNCYFRIEQFERACSIYKQVIEADPDFVLAYRNLGLSYARLDQLETALNYLMQYVEKVPDDYAIYQVMGELFVPLNHFSEAIGCFEKYLSVFPEDYKCLIQLSDTYLKMGHTDSAISGYKQALKLAPDCADIEQRLQSLLQEETV